jgi:hypothetical protein
MKTKPSKRAAKPDPAILAAVVKRIVEVADRHRWLPRSASICYDDARALHFLGETIP